MDSSQSLLLPEWVVGEQARPLVSSEAINEAAPVRWWKNIGVFGLTHAEGAPRSKGLLLHLANAAALDIVGSHSWICACACTCALRPGRAHTLSIPNGGMTGAGPSLSIVVAVCAGIDWSADEERSRVRRFESVTMEDFMLGVEQAQSLRKGPRYRIQPESDQ
ncbi:hypothetical protein HG531_002160 [Fusarium graminearum]|nr:hypothetical protein HG531_002160 [Fusarium graminearum]